MLEVLNADFLRTARAKGVPERAVIRKHALRNAWIPIITQLGTSLGTQLAGSVVVETVFAWPGVGRGIVEAISARDVPQATGFIIMTSILFVILQVIVDLLYAFVDPRIKAQYIGSAKKKRAATKMTGQPQFTLATGPPGSLPDSFEERINDFSGHEDVLQNKADDGATGRAEAPAHSYVTRDFSIVETVLAAEGEDAPSLESSTKSAELVSRRYRKKSRIGEILHHMRNNKGAMAGLITLGVMILMAIGSLAISWDAITLANMQNVSSAPSWQNPFGTDRMGRDLFLRVLYGSRYSLMIGFGAVAIAALFGITLGSFAGFFGGKTDHIIMRFSDTISSIPGILLGMVIMIVLGINIYNLLIAVGVGSIPAFLRITRASILSVRNHEFVEAARAIGLSNFRILFTQVLPNGLSPIIVTTTTSLGQAIIIASSLSFLGFGVQVPTPEWGALIAAGRDLMRTAPWLMTFPGIFIVITVLAFNLLGDGLRDALDPKLKKR